MNGFDEAGFAAGSVTGVRWWHLTQGVSYAFDSRNPDQPATLMGARGSWQPGENHADCQLLQKFTAGHKAPVEECGCGFWAYWTRSATSPVLGRFPVLGVIEGYGTTLIGDLGFRCEKARIVALCCMFTIKVPDPAWRPEPAPRGWNPATMFDARGQGLETLSAITGRTYQPRAPASPPLIDDADALTEIEMRLEDRYQVPVYATPDYMLLKHPPTTDYLPAPARPDPLLGNALAQQQAAIGLPGGQALQITSDVTKLSAAMAGVSAALAKLNRLWPTILPPDNS